MENQTIEGEPSPTSVINKLPDDPQALDLAIAPCKVMVRPILHGISRICQHAGTSQLDKEEIDSGAIAWGALMYQYGAMLDAKVLVALWSAGVAIPRVLEYMEQREERRKNHAQPVIQGPTAGMVAESRA